MKICPKCNAQLPDEAAFCNICGTPQNAAPAEDKAAEDKPVEEKAAEEKPAENNATENKPAEDKPIEEKPAEEKLAEDKPVEEKSAEDKPAEDKPAEDKPAEDKPEAPVNTGSFIPGSGAAGGFASNTGSFDAGAASAPVNGFAAAPVEGAAIAADNAAEAAKKKKLTQLLIICGAAAAALLVIIVIIVLLAGGGYKKPIKKIVKLVNKESTDVSAYLECATPSFTASTYKELVGLIKGGDAKKELDYAIKDGFADAFDDLEDEFGKNWKVSVEYKNVKAMKSKDLSSLEDSYQAIASLLKAAELDDEDAWDEISDSLDDEYDSEINASKAAKAMDKFIDNLDDIEFTKGYEVKLKITIKGKDDKDSETVTVYVVKNKGGKYFIDPSSLASQVGVNPYSLINQLDFDF